MIFSELEILKKMAIINNCAALTINSAVRLKFIKALQHCSFSWRRY